MSLFPNVSVSLHPLSLCVTCHLSLHSPQPNISIMDVSDHVSVCFSVLLHSAPALCLDCRPLTMSCNIINSDAFALVFSMLSLIPLEYTDVVLCLI